MKRPIVLKNYRKFYVRTSIQKILEILFRSPEKEFSLSELAKEAEVSKAQVSVLLGGLEKDGLASIEKLTKIWRIRANQKSQEFIRNKILYNLNFVYSSGLVDFLNEYFRNPSSMILFGSFRKGEDLQNSDIDIAIESRDLKEYKILELKELKEFEDAIGKKIQIHLFKREITDIHVFNNIANGIVLMGFLEVKS